MRPADLPAALTLWATAAGVELSEGDTLSELHGYLDRNGGCSQVALIDHRLVGAVLAGHDGRRGYLYHLAVEAAAQGRGFGQALVQASVAALRAAGVRRVLLLVARDNRRGAQFWQANGCEPLASVDVYGLDL